MGAARRRLDGVARIKPERLSKVDHVRPSRVLEATAVDEVLFVLDTPRPINAVGRSEWVSQSAILNIRATSFQSEKHKVMHIGKSPYPSFKSCSDSSTTTRTTRPSISSCAVGGSIRADVDMVSCGHDDPKVF